ncbi:unnamed protein product, partial [Staurois parvus]
MYKKNDIFKNFQISRGFQRPYVPTAQGSEHRSQMLASARGDGQGCCRGHIAGAKDKVCSAGNPYAAPHGKPECSSGLPLLVLK